MHRVGYTAFHNVSYHPASGHGMQKGATAQVGAPGFATLRSVDPLDAPVVFRLNAPGGVEVDVRMVDGQLMRPVRKPGSREGCGVEDLGRFLLARPGWRDDPLCNRRMATDRVYQGDHKTISAVLAGARRFEPYEDAMRAAMGAAGSALDRLAEIGGVVMMPCQEPRLNVVELQATGGGPRRLEVTWEFSDHGAHDDPAWGRIDEALAKDPRTGFTPRSVVKYPFAPREEYGNPAAVLSDTVATFAVDREEDARNFVRSLAAAHKLEAGGPVMVAYADPSAVTHVDETHMIPAIVKKSFSFLPQHEWGEALNASDATVRDWLVARAAVAAWPEHPDEVSYREGMDMVADVAFRTNATRRNSPFAAAMHRWVAADRGRDLSAVPYLNPDAGENPLASFAP